MISDQLLPALKRQLTRLEKNLRATVEGDPALGIQPSPEAKAHLNALYEDARAKQRTAATWSAWLDETVTQVGAAWLLGCVFLRFLEDNQLVETPWLAGAGDRGKLALDARTLYFRQPGHGHLSDTDYLTHCFREAARLPGLRDFFRAEHNPLWLLAPADDAKDGLGSGAELLALWHATDPDTGALRFDFTDPQLATRFLGDLYQDLSEDARKRFALLQTPVFVEEFILDRTLEPALRDFGLREVRMIDPTCGSGHFLLGGFARLLARWQQAEPGTNPRVLVQRALEAVAGVDLNPFAAAIARFRLLIAALRGGQSALLTDAPDYKIHVTVGDSLIHGTGFASDRYFGGHEALEDLEKDTLETEDPEALRAIFGRHYHAVVGNPPYITVKDKKLNERYRLLWDSCHRKYSLAVPFFERFWTLAEPGDPPEKTCAGYIGMITANSFIKREFGSKLVERFLPKWDLTHVIDTSGAYIPGHGTPTVIIFGKNQPPVAPTIRTVLGIRGEPATPEDPAQGLVWQAILQQVDEPGSDSAWMSAADSTRANFHKHPWSIGGGGAAELKEQIDDSGKETLNDAASVIGVFGMTNADDVMLAPAEAFQRSRVEAASFRPVVLGDLVRDWVVAQTDSVLFPYDENGLRQLADLPWLHRWLWPTRTTLGNRATFGKNTYFAEGRAWWAWHQVALERLQPPLTITFGFVATHNHFVIDRGEMVFKQSAPIIKLKSDATFDDHFALLGLLNSSLACFWMKQVMSGKHKGDGGTAHASPEGQRFEFDSTKMGDFPLPKEKPLALARELDRLALALQRFAPDAVLADASNHARAALDRARQQWTATLHRMVALQEELDWACYRAYGLIEGHDLLAPTGPDGLPVMDGPGAVVPPLRPGERAFEILLARAVARQAAETTWFERHAASGMVRVTEPPAHWPVEYTALYHRRHLAIQENSALALIERPEYKRRWNVEPWDAQLARALRTWLLDRLEAAASGQYSVFSIQSEGGSVAGTEHWPLNTEHSAAELLTCARLADRVRRDADFLRVAELHAGRLDFDLTRLVTDLVRAESVPYLPHQRYRESGRRKRRDWEKTWDLQRREDAIDADASALSSDPKDGHPLTSAEKHIVAQERKAKEIGTIAVPEKYKSSDFTETSYWRLRGKLDVPKERFISYPAAERDTDPTPVILWAGFDHLQQAQALANYYTEMRETVGWPLPRLLPLLAGLLELIPWLKQWHNGIHSEYQQRMGDFYADFVSDQARALGTTVEGLKALAFGEP